MYIINIFFRHILCISAGAAQLAAIKMALGSLSVDLLELCQVHRHLVLGVSPPAAINLPVPSGLPPIGDSGWVSYWI